MRCDWCPAENGGGERGLGCGARKTTEASAAKPVVFQPAHANSAASYSTNTRPSTSSQRIKIITQEIKNCSHLIIPSEASIRTRKWRSGPSPAPSPLHCAALPARSPAKSHTHTKLSRRRIAWRTTCSAKATSNASQQAKTLPGGQNALTRTTNLPLDPPETLVWGIPRTEHAHWNLIDSGQACNLATRAD